MSKQTTDVRFPEKLLPVFEPWRYKILYGGRGGAKSWGVARALLIMGAQRPLRILCAREIQKSIADSVHKLLSDQVSALGLSGTYEVLQKEIRGKNGTEFSFAGLKHNIDNIKSIEGTDIVWVEEAQTVSKTSWNTLIPTIRKASSEIWVTFNPGLEEDETYQRFVKSPRDDALVLKVNWSDNPWFPDVLRKEKDQLKERDPDSYLNVWEGHCRQTLDGAIYAKELRAARKEGRITKVPYYDGKPVSTFWDLGQADKTTIWFCQMVGLEYRIIDYYENTGEKIPHYLKVLQDKPYLYHTHWLPHDAEAEQQGASSTIQSQVQSANKPVRIVPKLSKADGINAARTIFSNCWFDEDKCSDGLMALRHYQYEVDPDTGAWSRQPLHNWASHAADAFRYLAIAFQDTKAPAKPKLVNPLPGPRAGGWMG